MSTIISNAVAIRRCQLVAFIAASAFESIAQLHNAFMEKNGDFYTQSTTKKDIDWLLEANIISIQILYDGKRAKKKVVLL